MCGIVGFAGHEPAAPVLLDGLSKLEYRGYDSAGICVEEAGRLLVAKAKGRLENLCRLVDGGKHYTGTTGIGHTRWATHGAPSDVNAHPHIDDSGTIAVVHNGIIENYMQIKEKLLAKGIQFQSETDTEVVANLVGYYYEQTGDFLEAVREAVARVEGSYALGIMCLREPGRIIAVKKESPLIFGYGDGACYIASDVPAILKYTREVIYLENGDMVDFTADGATFYDAAGDPVERTPEHIGWDIASAEKGGYAHFMLKEIYEQPRAIRETLSPRIKNGRVELENVEFTSEYLRNLRRIYMVACGSAYYVGVVGKYVLERMCQMQVEPVLASEFRYSDPVLDETTLVVIISQSGETADTLAALREAKRRGARTLAIVNVVGSSIAKAADDVLYTWAGPEISVATTKAYSTQLAMVDLLALYFADKLGTIAPRAYQQFLREIQRIPDQLESVLSDKNRENLQYFASLYFDNQDVFYIGRNVDSATCLEGSLKLKEIAYIHSEAYAAGELKHGPISLIEDGTLVVAVATNPMLFDKTMSNVKEVKARGAEVFAVTIDRFAGEVKKYTDNAVTIPVTNPLLQPNLSVVPLQLFAYYVALLRGCDIDKPRNLAKSVTVE